MDPRRNRNAVVTDAQELPAGFVSSRIQRLLKRTRPAPGSRVLIAGCANPRLLRSLVWLGLDVTGIDESEDAVALAALQVPEARYEIGLLPRTQFQDRSSLWDLVIACDQSTWSLNLLSEAAFARTTDLMMCLRSGGFLGFNDGDSLLPHQPACYRMHLRAMQQSLRSTGLSNAIVIDETDMIVERASGDDLGPSLEQLARTATQASPASCCRSEVSLSIFRP